MKYGRTGHRGVKKGEVVMTTLAPAVPTTWYWNRWVQLVLGLIAMMAISSPQYVWTLFTGPLNQKLGTTLAELQWTFSLQLSCRLGAHRCRRISSIASVRDF